MDPIDIQRPGMSEEHVWVSKWIIADGAPVNEGEIICELETAKATLEYPAPCDGILHHLTRPMEDLGWTGYFARIMPHEE